MPIFLKGKKMSKQIKPAELAEIVKRLLTEPVDPAKFIRDSCCIFYVRILEEFFHALG